jgi:hypothetical protein
MSKGKGKIEKSLAKCNNPLMEREPDIQVCPPQDAHGPSWEKPMGRKTKVDPCCNVTERLDLLHMLFPQIAFFPLML